MGHCARRSVVALCCSCTNAHWGLGFGVGFGVGFGPSPPPARKTADGSVVQKSFDCCGSCRYKYIYVRSPKSASTSIVDVLGECNNNATRGFNSSSCMVLHFYWNSTELALDNIQQMWQDYFVFGFARNPWKRAYSFYKYLHSNGCMPE